VEPRTLCEIFYRSVDTLRKPNHIMVKRGGQWRDVDSDEIRRTVEELSLGLEALGVQKGDRVAILSENRPEWAYADMAALCAGGIVVTIYPSLSSTQVLYVLKDSGAKAVVVSNAAQAAKIEAIRSQAPDLRHVILMDDGEVGGTVGLKAVCEQGRRVLEKEPGTVRRRAAERAEGDVATIIYTSGTTGEPKGVMLTHGNLVSNVIAGAKVFPDFAPTDVSLSFLPLCHVFERMGGYYLLLYAGVTIAYAESIEKVPDNMLEVKPTIMFSVPRLYEKIYARVQDKVASDPPLRQKVYRWAMSVGRRRFQCFVDRKAPGLLLKLEDRIAEALVFGKIKARTGGRLRLFVSGGAPLAREIAEFFGSVGLLILEGYGLTETSPVICVNRPNRMRPGTVGPPVEGVEAKIADDGEILTRGPHVMKGYYNKPEATAEAIDADGWFHTGDIGVFDSDGFLVITDRKKDLLVTSGGKKVAPQPIENRIKTDPLIAEIVMVGNKRNFPAALVVPAFGALERWATEKGVAFSSHEQLVADPRVTKLYKDLVDGHCLELAQFEKIKRIAVLPKEFTLESGELTPTLKVKRRVVEDKHKDLIDRLYGSAE
jgi:long-chain acyl-CoA synthetase